jgi:hypothetical protein
VLLSSGNANKTSLFWWSFPMNSRFANNFSIDFPLPADFCASYSWLLFSGNFSAISSRSGVIEIVNRLSDCCCGGLIMYSK